MTTIGFKSQSNINSNYMPDLIVQTEADISPDQTKEIETEQDFKNIKTYKNNMPRP